jgi:hypothetical protein
MTRSIFDPTGGETEHSGSRNLGPDAAEISHMPPDVVDGVVDADDANDTIDMTPPDANTVESVDAPQESDMEDDPDLLMEGQSTDESDAPQEDPE